MSCQWVPSGHTIQFGVCFEILNNIGHYHRTQQYKHQQYLVDSHGKEAMWSMAQTPLDVGAWGGH
jgi:hypothetical protein